MSAAQMPLLAAGALFVLGLALLGHAWLRSESLEADQLRLFWRLALGLVAAGAIVGVLTIVLAPSEGPAPVFLKK